MESLRSSQSRQKSQRQTTRLAKPAPSGTIRRNDRKSTVDAKIKKRMSMRYADISAPTNIGNNVPSVPAIPIGLARSATSSTREQDEEVRERTRPKEDTKAAEMKLLDKGDFDPDAYLKVKLANSTEAELKSLQSSLRSAKDDTATDLQRNVFKNYAEFVLVSKEVSVLENEMLELKESLAEWKSMPSLLHIDESASVAGKSLLQRRRNVRSSIADLRILYANQMQTLHSQIEGSTKFIPTTPGRHVITEMDGILALNAATYKVERTVKFVVLDDAVLVARRRRKGAGEGGGSGGGGAGGEGAGKLVAEKCWLFNEMLVLDTKDTALMTNVFKIRHGRETHVYRTDTPSEKKSLLSHFRQAAEELATKKQKEREGEHERRKSLWAALGFGGGDKMPPIPDWMAELNQQTGMTMGSTAKDKLERDTRWVGEFADDLTVAIALREWDRAVELVEQGETKLPTTPLLSSKLPSLTQTLTTSLLSDLASPLLRKSTVIHLISLLNRLHAGPAARNTFLEARTEVMRKRVRMIRFEGHVGVYVNDLAMVVFTGIKHTADWFLASFKENEVASCFVEWARKQIESYAEMFRKQVYTSDVDPQTVDEAIRITHSQSRRLLEEYGLDFRYLLDGLLIDKSTPTSLSPFPAHAPVQIQPPQPTRTPATTPTAGRSPMTMPRSRSPVPPLPPLTTSSQPTSTSTPSPLTAPKPVPPRLRSPAPTPVSPSSQTSSPVRSVTPSERPPPRSMRGSPVPLPPRSRDRDRERPGSATGHRPPPPPVATMPRNEGMF
ncbi:hypothetical protein JAAARDRAFT_140823 [Jaapia argillacea MUCL 33604]|uniref:Exocyst complex component EXO84 n=1 Tax=Jaapia argillacea MUCL 33604 TaxID=933084 RepID=A0A067PJB6_9AGAM|nr:hypothetical protein JAAARDRAFT_140823 [Jaapia argillacea MUCL 33604]